MWCHHWVLQLNMPILYLDRPGCRQHDEQVGEPRDAHSGGERGARVRGVHAGVVSIVEVHYSTLGTRAVLGLELYAYDS